MQTEGPDEGSPGGAEGPPSARSREALTDELRRELADARLRLEEAGLRAEAHHLLGNHDQAVEATQEQQAILADVEARLGRVVSTAVVQRDAEQVLARATGLPAPAPADARQAADASPRAPMLSGVVSVLALAAVAAAAVLGVTRGLAPVEVVGAAADGPTQGQADVTPSPEPAPTRPPPAAVASAGDRSNAPAPESAPSSPADAPSAATPAGVTGQGDRGQPTDDPTDVEDSELGQAVDDLLEAVGQLGGDGGPDAPTPSDDATTPSDDAMPGSDADMSGPDVEDVLEEPIRDEQGGETDGFVPAPSAQ